MKLVRYNNKKRPDMTFQSSQDDLWLNAVQTTPSKQCHSSKKSSAETRLSK